jgi:hypothetical protein
MEFKHKKEILNLIKHSMANFSSIQEMYLTQKIH